MPRGESPDSSSRVPSVWGVDCATGQEQQGFSRSVFSNAGRLTWSLWMPPVEGVAGPEVVEHRGLGLGVSGVVPATALLVDQSNAIWRASRADMRASVGAQVTARATADRRLAWAVARDDASAGPMR